MNRKFLILVSLFIISVSLFAQNVKFTAFVTKKVVRQGEQFQLKYTVNESGTSFRPAAFRDFNVLSGPNTSRSSSSSIINGQISKSIEYTYAYYLSAKKIGKFTIAQAQINVGGKIYKSNPVTIEVIKSANQSGKQNNSNSSASSNITNKDLYVSIQLNKSEVFLGEHIIATIKIYTKLNLSNIKDATFPSFRGFVKQDIRVINDLSQLSRENVNGDIFNVGIIQQSVLFPQRSGEIVIEPFEAECIIRQETGRRSFFGPSYKNVIVKAKSHQRKIKVKPLPANKPDGFNGSVGSMKMTTSINKQNVKVNDAITLKVKISGNGNLKVIDPLQIKFPTDFEIYDPKISNNLKSGLNGVSGSKTFEYLLIPRHAGDFEISPIEFSHFDTKSKTYKTIKSQAYKIHVEKGEDDDVTSTISGFSKENVKFIGKDIRFIKKDKMKLQKSGVHFFGSNKFYSIYLVSFLIFIVAFLINRKKIRDNSNIVLVKNKRANKEAKKRLKMARQFMKENKDEQFFKEIIKAIWGYLSDKMNIPFVDLSKESAIETLRNNKIDDETISKFEKLIDTCEFARYSQVQDSSQTQNIYHETMSIFSIFEQKIKK
ncbi:MAG: protein BatD [Bacteroidetes bacterium]|jgi:hypothetical protein|nr:protein BatD [Bacteroidota bacterium]MBT6687670.1 protein BatD [Bacteroidota bacterium]MBT7142490.1 protein BatD [Bacteroidota bacterium]MBT7493342.1 protein BatD [Bacteroidota bacterium]